MLPNILNSSFNLTEFEAELKEEFNKFYRSIEDCNKINNAVKEGFNDLKKNFENTEKRGSLYKRKIEEEIDRNKKREKESVNLVSEIKQSYERNIAKLRDHHKKQILNLFEKHKLEIQKWKSKYEKVKFDKKTDITESEDASIERKFLKEKLEKQNKELASLQSKNESFEQELSKIKKEKKSLLDDHKDAQKDHTKLKNDVTHKEKEVSQLKSKIKDLESKLKAKEETINKKDEQLQTIKDELDGHKLRCEELSDEVAKLSEVRRAENSNHHEEAPHDSSVDRSELAMLRIELRSARRDLDTRTNIVNMYRQEKTDLKAQISEFERKLNLEKETHLEERGKLERCRRDISKHLSTIEKKDEEIMKLKNRDDENSKNMDSKLKELNDTKKSEKKWKDKCVQFEQKQQSLLNEIETIKRKNAAIKVDIDRKNKEIEQLTTENNKLSKSYDALKKVTQELEQQVNKYNEKYSDVNSEKKCLIKEKTSIDDTVIRLNEDLKLSKHQIKKLNDEKENLLARISKQDFDSKKSLSDEKIKFNKLKHEYDLAQDRCKRYEDKIEWLEENGEKAQYDLESANNKLDGAIAVSRDIKEEAAKHITKIAILEMKEKDLLNELHSKNIEIDELMEELLYLKQNLEIKEDQYYEFNIKTSETMSQQMKLIDHLQKKSESKKKILFPINPKFFASGHSEPKLNDYQKLWKSEKSKNTQLNEQLRQTNQELERNISEVSHLKTQISELRTQLLENISNRERRHKHRSIVSHDIPHQFIPFKVKFVTLCVSCAKKISHGQHAKKCQHCASTVHQNCNLVNNCGMPVDEARRAIHENVNDSSLNSDSDAVEPSAPEIPITEAYRTFDLEEMTYQVRQSVQSPNKKGSPKSEKFTFTDSITNILN